MPVTRLAPELDLEPGPIFAFGAAMLAGLNLKVFLILMTTGLALGWLPEYSKAAIASEEIRIQIPKIQLPSTNYSEGTTHRLEFGFSGYASVSNGQKSGKSQQLYRESVFHVNMRNFEWQILASRPYVLAPEASDTIKANLVFAHVNSDESRALMNGLGVLEVLRLRFNPNREVQKLYPALKPNDSPRLQVNFAQRLVWLWWPESPKVQPTWQKFDFNGNPIHPGLVRSLKQIMLNSCQALLGREPEPEEWPKE